MPAFEEYFESLTDLVDVDDLPPGLTADEARDQNLKLVFGAMQQTFGTVQQEAQAIDKDARKRCEDSPF